jgi:hypothetical protein
VTRPRECATAFTSYPLLRHYWYAVNKYAAYIQNEDPGAASHAARRNWQLKAQANIPAMAASLVQAICLDSNVVADLGAVTDVNLQTATETAANGLIGAPVSYVDLNALANDNTFLRRAQIAVAHFANYILNEQPNTANHLARYAWARNSILNTQGVANALAPAVVMDSVVGAALLGTISNCRPPGEAQEMGASAGFHSNQMNPQVRREAAQLRSRELLAHDHVAALVQTYQVKARLAEINADCV